MRIERISGAILILLSGVLLLMAAYMEDDHTVTALATGASVAGTVIRVDDEGVAVECGGYIPAAAAASVGG